jgi:hypothetical protein
VNVSFCLLTWKVLRVMKGITQRAQQLFARLRKMHIKVNKSKSIAFERNLLYATNQLIK